MIPLQGKDNTLLGAPFPGPRGCPSAGRVRAVSPAAACSMPALPGLTLPTVPGIGRGKPPPQAVEKAEAQRASLANSQILDSEPLFVPACLVLG